MGLSLARERLIGRLHRRRTREREGLVLAEGLRVVRSALDAGAELRFAVVSPRAEALDAGDLLARLVEAGVELVRVDDGEMRVLADTEAPQGLLAVARQPRWTAAEVVLGGRRLLVLDGIQDPGNAGTLVRTAAAFALDAVLALDGTVDPWNPKAVRASAGACFRIACVSERWEHLQPALVEAGLPLLVADAGGDEVGRVPGPPAWALVIGSEGGGARPEVRAAASTRVGVAMPGGTESLNAGVAGAILMFALTSRNDPRATARRGDSGA